MLGSIVGKTAAAAIAEEAAAAGEAAAEEAAVAAFRGSSQRAQPSELKPLSLPRLGAMNFVEVLQSPEPFFELCQFAGVIDVAKLILCDTSCRRKVRPLCRVLLCSQREC